MWGDCLFLFCSGSRFSFLKHFFFSLFSFILCAPCQDVLLGLLNSFQHRLLTCPLGHGHIQTLYFSTRSLFRSVVFITDGMNICVCEAAALHSFTATLTLIIRIFILPMNHVTAHMWKRFITGLLPPRTIHVLPDCVYLVFPTLFLQSASSVVHNLFQENLKCQSGSFEVSVLHFLSLRMDDSSNCVVNFFLDLKICAWPSVYPEEETVWSSSTDHTAELDADLVHYGAPECPNRTCVIPLLAFWSISMDEQVIL